MLRKTVGGVLMIKRGILALVLVLGVASLARPEPVQAHCDSVNGPVVKAAQEALATGEIRPVLAYVQADAEAELTAAFKHTLEVRALGSEARTLADRYFYETAVRLHRAGEGAAYTGLKEETDHGPALAAADAALESGSLTDVYKLLNRAMRDGVADKFAAVEAARENAAAEGTVASERERAEAELMFEKYIYELYNLASGQTVQAEGQTGHTHAAEQTGIVEPAHTAEE